MTYFAETYRTVVGAQRREAEERSPWHPKKKYNDGSLTATWRVIVPIC